MEEKVQRLKKMRIFSDFGGDEIHQVAKIAVEKIFPRGTNIIREGEIGEGLFTIVEGEVNVNKKIPGSKQEESIAVLKDGDHFGEMGLIDGKNASASVVACGPTICFVLKRKDYYDLLGREPIIAMKMYRFYTNSLCERLRHTDNFLLNELVQNKKKLEPGLLKGST